MIAVRFSSAGDWNAYRSHRSRRGSPMGGPRLSPVKWFDIVLSPLWIIFPSAEAEHESRDMLKKVIDFPKRESTSPEVNTVGHHSMWKRCRICRASECGSERRRIPLP